MRGGQAKGLNTALIPVFQRETGSASADMEAQGRFRFLSSLPPCLSPPPPSLFLPLLFTDPPSRDDVPGTVPSATAPNSSGGG